MATQISEEAQTLLTTEARQVLHLQTGEPTLTVQTTAILAIEDLTTTIVAQQTEATPLATTATHLEATPLAAHHAL